MLLPMPGNSPTLPITCASRKHLGVCQCTCYDCVWTIHRGASASMLVWWFVPSSLRDKRCTSVVKNMVSCSSIVLLRNSKICTSRPVFLLGITMTWHWQGPYDLYQVARFLVHFVPHRMKTSQRKQRRRWRQKSWWQIQGGGRQQWQYWGQC